MDRQKCSQCRVNLPLDHFKVKRSGDKTKYCIHCLEKSKKYRDRYKCTHGKLKYRCQECHGGCLCEHDRIRTTCKECGGSQVCEHNRIKSTCIKCKGGGTCEHNKIRSRCVQCHGGQICQHNKRRSDCKKCKGSQICEHDKLKSHCKLCKGSQVCEHDTIRSSCTKCKGTSVCEHNRRRHVCKECNGNGICEHGKVKNTCKECRGGSRCEHNIMRNKCKECDFEGYLSSKVRNSVNRALNADKNKKSLDYLGCDIETFKKHIEDEFEEEMSWENYGKSSSQTRRWQIDHITPIKYGNPTLEEVIERLHYTNTMPLWHDENLAKSNKYVGKPKKK